MSGDEHLHSRFGARRTFPCHGTYDDPGKLFELFTRSGSMEVVSSQGATWLLSMERLPTLTGVILVLCDIFILVFNLMLYCPGMLYWFPSTTDWAPLASTLWEMKRFLNSCKMEVETFF